MYNPMTNDTLLEKEVAEALGMQQSSFEIWLTSTPEHFCCECAPSS